MCTSAIPHFKWLQQNWLKTNNDMDVDSIGDRDLRETDKHGGRNINVVLYKWKGTIMKGSLDFQALSVSLEGVRMEEHWRCAFAMRKGILFTNTTKGFESMVKSANVCLKSGFIITLCSRLRTLLTLERVQCPKIKVPSNCSVLPLVTTCHYKSAHNVRCAVRIWLWALQRGSIATKKSVALGPLKQIEGI